MSKPIAAARPLGAGRAAQMLDAHARRLSRSEDRRDQRLAEALAVILAQRGRLLTEKFGPERDFSRELRIERKPRDRHASLRTGDGSAVTTKDLAALLLEAADHIQGVTGALPGSESAEIVDRARAACEKVRPCPDAATVEQSQPLAGA